MPAEAPAIPASGRLLAVDTAGEHCSACLLDLASGGVLSRADPVVGRGHAERLMGILADVLAAGGCGYAELSKIAVSVGPGSFTGIRVGVAAARGLALSLAVPAVGISTLEALAGAHRGRGVPVLAVRDAGRGEVHAALFAADGSVLKPAAALAPDALPDFCGGAGDDLLVTGTGASIARRFLPDWRLLVADESGAVDIAVLAALGAARVPGESPKPLYLRGADAKPQAARDLRSQVPASIRA